jgi:hypothetical protein
MSWTLFTHASPDMPRSCLASLLPRLALARLASQASPSTAPPRLAMKRRLKTERKALRLATFAVVSTHEQPNSHRTVIPFGGHLSGID